MHAVLQLKKNICYYSIALILFPILFQNVRESSPTYEASAGSPQSNEEGRQKQNASPQQKQNDEFRRPPIKRRNTSEEPIVEAVTCMKRHVYSVPKRDQFSVYGEHIANKLRNSGRSKFEIALAQRYIDDICFKLVVGEYAKHFYPNTSQVQQCSPPGYENLNSPLLVNKIEPSIEISCEPPVSPASSSHMEHSPPQ